MRTMFKLKVSKLNSERLNQLIIRYIYFFIRIYLITLYRMLQFVRAITTQNLIVRRFQRHLQEKPKYKDIPEIRCDVQELSKLSSNSKYNCNCCYEFQYMGLPNTKCNITQPNMNKQYATTPRNKGLLLCRPIDLLLFTKTAGTIENPKDTKNRTELNSQRI